MSASNSLIEELKTALKHESSDRQTETLRRINELEETIPNPMTEDGLRRL